MESQEKNQQEIGKELDLTNPEDLPEYIQPFSQQEEIREVTRIMRMGPQNQFNKRSTKETKCKGLCNNNQERRSIESIVK